MRIPYYYALVILGLVLACPVSGTAGLVYVDDDRPAGGGGQSWATAYRYLQDALAAAAGSGGTINEIWVAGGIYQPDRSQAYPAGSGSRAATFQLLNGVAVRGGFAGDEDPVVFNLQDRDFAVHETILSGDLAGNDGPGFTNNGENSYHVVTGGGTDATAVLDGFTVSGGNANGTLEVDRHGGGLYVLSGSPVVAYCVFSGNSAGYGGGMYGESGGPALSECHFGGNGASKGGGLYSMSSSVRLTDCTFDNNLGGDGGGMWNNAGSPRLVDCAFSGNSATGACGGMLNSGGDLKMTNCTFTGNSSNGGGGGMCHVTGSPVLTNCTFTENSGSDGGGMWNFGNPVLANCTFSTNTASRGGGVYSPASMTLANCILWGDTATTSPEIFGTAAVSYSCVQGGWTGTGNISVNPMFASGSGNLGLLVGSPCIDVGNNSALPADWADLDNDGDVSEPLPVDLEGKYRVLDGDGNMSFIVDMGAYEYAGYPRLVDLGSRRAHGGAGVLEIELPLDGRFVDSGECRIGGPAELVFTFSETVVAADGLADVSEVELSAGVVDVVVIAGNTMTVTMHNVPDVSWLRIVLSGLVDLDGNPLMGDVVYVRVLSGDVTGSGTVNAFDVTGVRARLGQVVSATNCRYDVTASGAINAFDLTFVRARLGWALPSTWP